MSQVHRYRIVRPVAVDQIGMVYQADQLDRWGKISAQLALVVFRPEAESAVVRLRALEPRMRLARSAAIARYHDIIRFQDRWGALRELYDGLVASDIAPLSALPPVAVAEIGVRLASALHEAYGLPGPDGTPQRLLHGSVRSQNVVLSVRGQVALLGFGAVGEDPEECLLPEDSTAWVPPERWRGRHHQAGEVYSLATVLFQLLTGTEVGRAGSDAGAHAQLLEESLTRVRPLGEAWVDLLGEALAWRAEDRPSCLELQRRCSAIVGDRMGVLRTWVGEHLPGLMRKVGSPETDDFCNMVFEGAAVAELDPAVDQGVMAWDDVTSSYPLGALRSAISRSTEEELSEEPPALESTPLIPAEREAAPDEPARSRGPYFLLFVVSLVVAVVLLAALAVVLGLLAVGVLG